MHKDEFQEDKLNLFLGLKVRKRGIEAHIIFKRMFVRMSTLLLSRVRIVNVQSCPSAAQDIW